MLKIPNSVKREAKNGVLMKLKGYEGATDTGWSRGIQLATMDHISVDVAINMKNWFARHVYTSKPSYDRWLKQGEPMSGKDDELKKWRGAVAYLLWGGESARKWLNRLPLD